MLKSLSLLLTLSACSTVHPTKFDGEWEFLANERGEVRACLSEKDVGKLRELLIRQGE